MKLVYLFLLLSLTTHTLMAQDKLTLGKQYIEIEDPKHPDHSMLKGQVDDAILTDFENNSWYSEGKSSYEADPKIVNEIAKNINDYEVYAFGGTWCPDTRALLPKFMAVVQAAELAPERLTIFAVDHQKNALNVEREMFDIERVPTFIFYKNNNEKGRIVESVEGSIEKAILEIIE